MDSPTVAWLVGAAGGKDPLSLPDAPLPTVGSGDFFYDIDFPPLPAARHEPVPENSAHAVTAAGDSLAPQSFLSPPAIDAARLDRKAAERRAFLVECLDAVVDASFPSEKKVASQLRLKVLRAADTRGVGEALKLAKKLSGDARSSWILRSGSSAHAQISFLGRSLPTADAAACSAALEDHKRHLGSEHLTPAHVLDRARIWAASWGRRFLSDPRRSSSSGIPTLSACAERTASKGGLRGFVRDLGVHPEAAALEDDLSEYLPPQDVAVLIQDFSLFCHGRDLCEKGLPSHRVSVLAERGLKTRVVSAPGAGLSLLGHVIRKRLLAGLRRDSRSQSTLVGLKDEDLIAFFEGSSGDIVVSTDLKAASDLLPLDLVAAIVEGLSRSGRVPAWEAKCLRLLTGPQTLVYPDGSELVSKRGILMGLPTTWALLSLIHLFWWDEAVAQECRSRKDKLASFRRLNRFATCGDDGLACVSSGVPQRFSSLVHLCGGSPSAGKHFECGGGNRRRAVFIERLYEFSVKDGLVSGGCRHSAIPLRGLVRPSETQELRGHGPGLVLSSRLKLLLSVDSCWHAHPSGAPRLCSWLKPRQRLREFGVGLGLVDGLPLRLGGNGCPPPSGCYSRKALERRYVAHLRLVEGGSVPSLIRGVIDPTWKMASEMVGWDIQDFLDAGVFVRQPADADPPSSLSSQEVWVKGTAWPEMVDACTERCYVSLCLQLGGSSFTPRLRERELKRAFAEYFGLQIPKGADLNDPPQPPSELGWVKRTRGPDGTLLFPQWAGEHLATEAALRSVNYWALARGSRALS